MSRRRRLAAVIAAGLLTIGACSDTATPDPQPGSTPPGTTSPAELAEDAWRQRAAAPNRHTEVAAGVLGDRIWVVGGMTDSGEPVSDVAIYDPAANAWEKGPELPEKVHHAGAAGDGSRLWVVGGYEAHESTLRQTDAVWVLDSATRQWRSGPALPAPVAAGALAWDGSRLLFGGGVGPDGLSGDVFALDGDRWRSIGTLSTAREHLAAASDGQGNTWFLGGRLGGLDTNRSDVDLASGDRVTRVGQVPTARGGVAGFHVPGLGGCVAGGEEPSGTRAEVECINTDGATAALPSLGASRHGLGAAVLDGVAYTLLGGSSPGLSVSDVVEALRVDGRG